MTEYQFVRLNASGLIDSSERSTFLSDDAALERAREMRHSGRVEVWAGKTKIGLVMPAAPERRGVKLR